MVRRFSRHNQGRGDQTCSGFSAPWASTSRVMRNRPQASTVLAKTRNFLRASIRDRVRFRVIASTSPSPSAGGGRALNCMDDGSISDFGSLLDLDLDLELVLQAAHHKTLPTRHRSARKLSIIVCGSMPLIGTVEGKRERSHNCRTSTSEASQLVMF